MPAIMRASRRARHAPAPARAGSFAPVHPSCRAKTCPPVRRGSPRSASRSKSPACTSSRAADRSEPSIAVSRRPTARTARSRAWRGPPKGASQSRRERRRSRRGPISSSSNGELPSDRRTRSAPAKAGKPAANRHRLFFQRSPHPIPDRGRHHHRERRPGDPGFTARCDCRQCGPATPDPERDRPRTRRRSSSRFASATASSRRSMVTRLRGRDAGSRRRDLARTGQQALRNTEPRAAAP